MKTSRGMQRFGQAIEFFRQAHRDILANEMLTFVIVAQNDGLQMSELQDRLGLSQAATSRNVNFLTKHGANERPGLELLRLAEDIENRRRRRVYLTPKGKAFARTLEVIVGESD